MRARSALFDVYGDLLPERGHQACVADLVRLLEPVGIAAPAVRTAISRMVQQGWLEPVRLSTGRGYRATPRAISRLSAAGRRVYRRSQQDWSGRWHVAFVRLPQARSARTQVRRDLGYLGYAEFAEGVWISPASAPELSGTLARAGASLVSAQLSDLEPATAPLSAWDVAGLAAAYQKWLSETPAILTAQLAQRPDPDVAAYAARFHLVHEWRKFLFTDPGLPTGLLPQPWPGDAAAAYFAARAEELRPGADRYVDRIL